MHVLAKGLLLGLLSTFTGWLKNSKPGKLSWKGFVVRLPAGLIVGYIAAVYNLQFDDVVSFLSGLGLIEVLDQIVKGVIRRFDPDWLKIDNGGIPDVVDNHTSGN